MARDPVHSGYWYSFSAVFGVFMGLGELLLYDGQAQGAIGWTVGELIGQRKSHAEAFANVITRYP